jgi:hypothetical protein
MALIFFGTDYKSAPAMMYLISDFPEFFVILSYDPKSDEEILIRPDPPCRIIPHLF